jgi:hypothetical protein
MQSPFHDKKKDFYPAGSNAFLIPLQAFIRAPLLKQGKGTILRLYTCMDASPMG